MAINTESNGYTFAFAAVMVVVVGGILAFVSTSLKPIQKANVKNEKMQNILQAIGLNEIHSVERDAAGAAFNDYITRRITIDYKGNILSDKKASDPIDEKDPLDAFNIDLRKEYSKYVQPIINKNKGDEEKIQSELLANKNLHLPIFVCERVGKKHYVVATSGKGLWDDVWGYIGLQADGTTISGTVFDHKGETPGLGSKITEDWFTQQFVGKTLAEGSQFFGIKVLKPGKDLDNHQVDGISGATFTGVGVDEMISRNLKFYHQFFQNNKNL